MPKVGDDDKKDPTEDVMRNDSPAQPSLLDLFGVGEALGEVVDTLGQGCVTWWWPAGSRANIRGRDKVGRWVARECEDDVREVPAQGLPKFLRDAGPVVDGRGLGQERPALQVVRRRG
jgi:hypothetical protein